MFITLLFTIKIPSFHHLPYCPEYILMLGILQSVHHIPEHPCHTIGIIGVILVNNGVCKPYSACICRVYVLYFKLPAHQIGSKISAKASGIFKSKYDFLCPAIFLTSSTNAGYLDGLQCASLCISIPTKQVFRL